MTPGRLSLTLRCAFMIALAMGQSACFLIPRPVGYQEIQVGDKVVYFRAPYQDEIIISLNKDLCANANRLTDYVVKSWAQHYAVRGATLVLYSWDDVTLNAGQKWPIPVQIEAMDNFKFSLFKKTELAKDVKLFDPAEHLIRGGCHY
jgi:hypothetical protein